MNGHINNNARYLFDSPFSFYMICLQLCSMVRDMSVKVRIEVFIALGKIEIVSEYILLQTLSKKASSATKEMKFPGQYTKKISGYQHQVLVLLFYMGWRMNLVR